MGGVDAVVVSAGANTAGLGGPDTYGQSYGYDLTGNRTKEVDHHDVTGDTAKDVTHTRTYPAAGQPHPHAAQSMTSGSPATGTSTETFASEVLTDNGKQFTGRHNKPEPVEVLFERVCRENGITARRTKPRSPTTTGKAERFHKTLREELLDQVAPFASQEAAQQAIDEWVAAYNRQRPHQSLDMAVPATLFRPNGPARTARRGRLGRGDGPGRPAQHPPHPRRPPRRDGLISLKGEEYQVSNSFAGRRITLRLDGHLMHAIADETLIGTWPCSVSRDQLSPLRGARAASGCLPGPALPAGAMRVQRRGSDSGRIMVTSQRLKLGKKNASRLVTVIIEDTHFRILDRAWSRRGYGVRGR